MASRTLARIAEIAGEQWGLFTRQQARRAGIPLKTFDRLALEAAVLERVGHGVYRLLTAPMPDHLELRAAWLQLAPHRPAWERTAENGVVSHRSAALVYGIGHLTADEHEFTVGRRKQTRRPDVRLYLDTLRDNEWVELKGLPVTMPSRIAFDLLDQDEDPSAVAQLIADAVHRGYDYPSVFVDRLAPLSFKFGFRRGDGLALLTWLLDLVGDPQTQLWVKEAREEIPRRFPANYSMPQDFVHPQ